MVVDSVQRGAAWSIAIRVGSVSEEALLSSMYQAAVSAIAQPVVFVALREQNPSSRLHLRPFLTFLAHHTAALLDRNS